MCGPTASSLAAGVGVERQGPLSILVFCICVGIDFFSKGSICLLPNYVTNLHPSPLRVFIPVPQGCRFPGLPEIQRLKPFSGFLVKVLVSGNLTFLHFCFLDGVSLTTFLFYLFLQLIC